MKVETCQISCQISCQLSSHLVIFLGAPPPPWTSLWRIPASGTRDWSLSHYVVGFWFLLRLLSVCRTNWSSSSLLPSPILCSITLLPKRYSVSYSLDLSQSGRSLVPLPLPQALPRRCSCSSSAASPSPRSTLCGTLTAERRERACVCVCLCVRERERERERGVKE